MLLYTFQYCLELIILLSLSEFKIVNSNYFIFLFSFVIFFSFIFIFGDLGLGLI